jgi:hypothetical protein
MEKKLCKNHIQNSNGFEAKGNVNLGQYFGIYEEIVQGNASAKEQAKPY